jgi:outer membrane protein TolC
MKSTPRSPIRRFPTPSGFKIPVWTGCALCVLIIALVALVALVPNAAAAGKSDDGIDDGIKEPIKAGETLSIDRCIAIALGNQPSIAASRYTLEAGQSKVGQAQAGYYPNVDLTGGYRRYEPATASSGSTGSAGAAAASAGKKGPPFNEYTGGASVKQNIYDFGRTSGQVDVSRSNVEASAFDLENTTIGVVYNVKLAYYSLVYAKKSREVALEMVSQYQKHLDQAKGFYSVGVKAKYDVTTAEVNLANSRVNLIKAENAVKTARVNLNNSLGMPAAPSFEVEDALSVEEFDLKLEDALHRAFKERPDIKSMEAKVKTAGLTVELKKKDYWPTLSGSAAYNYAGEDFPLENGWSVGASVTLPVFSGFLTKKQVEEARANLNVVKANEESLRQNVIADVQQSYLNVMETKERILAAETAMRQAKENLDIATGRYNAGVGSPIEVTDAQTSYANASMTFIQAMTDYKTARAAIVKAMGGKQ